MKRHALLALAALMAGGLLVAGPAGQEPAFAGPQGGGPNGGSGIEWQYSESGNGFYRDPPSRETGGGGDGGPPTVLTITGPVGEWLRCDQSDPAFLCSEYEGPRDTETEAGIMGILCPEGPGDNGRPMYSWIRFTREIEDGEPTQWYGDEADCSEISDDDFIPIEEFSYTVDCNLFQPLGEPAIARNPQTKTFVNWPTIVSTDYPSNLDSYTASGDCRNDIDQPNVVTRGQDSVTLEIPIHINRPRGGLDGTVTAEAVYAWTFHDGENTASKSGRGRPYAEGRYPEDNPGYYITHKFANAGRQEITLTVSWTGSVTVTAPGIPPQTEEIDPVDVSNTVGIEVDQASPVLVR